MGYDYEYNKKWRKKNPYKWRLMKQRYYSQFNKGAYNKCQRWPIRDIKLVMEKKDLDRNIAKQIGRSVRAIQSIRMRLKSDKKEVK